MKGSPESKCQLMVNFWFAALWLLKVVETSKFLKRFRSPKHQLHFTTQLHHFLFSFSRELLKQRMPGTTCNHGGVGAKEGHAFDQLGILTKKI